MLLAVGIVYAVISYVTGFGIPCIFHTVTGLQCPGCGISRMFLSLFKGDIKAAWGYNHVILCLSPLFLVLIVHMSARYIKKGSLVPARWANILMCIMIGVLLVFGVLRNIPMFK